MSQEKGTRRDFPGDAARYWEARRVAYNFVLVIVAIAWLVVTWPHFRGALSLESLKSLLVLAAVANACYCVAYLVDIAMERSAFRAT
jgi:hypothetical protein